MDKTVFQKTEGKLYAYYQAIARRNQIRDRINRTEIRIRQVQRDLADIRIPIPSNVANYSGIVVSGREETSYAERAFSEIQDRLMQELVELKVRHLKLRQKLRELDKQWEGLTYIIDNVLDEEERFIAEQKYMYKLSLRQIADAWEKEFGEKKMFTRIQERRERIVYKVAVALKAA